MWNRIIVDCCVDDDHPFIDFAFGHQSGSTEKKIEKFSNSRMFMNRKQKSLLCLNGHDLDLLNHPKLYVDLKYNFFFKFNKIFTLMEKIIFSFIQVDLNFKFFYFFTIFFIIIFFHASNSLPIEFNGCQWQKWKWFLFFFFLIWKKKCFYLLNFWI